MHPSYYQENLCEIIFSRSGVSFFIIHTHFLFIGGSKFLFLKKVCIRPLGKLSIGGSEDYYTKKSCETATTPHQGKDCGVDYTTEDKKGNRNVLNTIFQCLTALEKQSQDYST